MDRTGCRGLDRNFGVGFSVDGESVTSLRNEEQSRRVGGKRRDQIMRSTDVRLDKLHLAQLSSATPGQQHPDGGQRGVAHSV